MDAKRWAPAAACAGAVILAAGCGSSSSSATTANSATVTVTVTQTSSTSSGTGTGSATGTATGTTTTGGAQNLVVTSALRTQLVQAGAASNNVPAADYIGLAPGSTYYAYDPATGTYWAGARLVPTSSSIKAQVSVQDDGGYLLFTKPSGGTWKVYPVGMTGVGGAACPVTVPAAVLTLWGWKSGSCRPGA